MSFRAVSSALGLVSLFVCMSHGGELIGPGQDEFDRELGIVGDVDRPVNYELFRPADYESSGELPLTIFLHGLTDGFAFKQSRLNDTMRGLVHATQRDNVTAGGCDLTDTGGTRPLCVDLDDAYESFLLVPKVANGDSWSSYITQLGDLIADTADRYPVDQDRIYVLGYSDGGFRVVDLLSHRSDLFAAGVPISAGGDASSANVTALLETPTWFFHGSSDPVVAPQRSIELATLVQSAGGDAQLSMVPGGHNAGYEAAFRSTDNELFPWLFEQEKTHSADAPIPMVASYLVHDVAVDGVADDMGDEVINTIFQRTAAIGERDGSQINYTGRLFAKFDLPTESASADSLEQATLRFYLRNVSGDLAGPLSVFHSIENDRIAGNVADFEDATYRDTGVDLLQEEDGSRMWYEVDVTEFVKLDLEQDANPRSAFRFQVDNAMFVEDGESGNFRVETSGPNRAELLLTFAEGCDPNSDGDINGDGRVQFDDFLILSANYGDDVAGQGHELGDLDCNGTVEFDDFLALSDNYGAVADVANVPEPNSGWISLVVFALLGSHLRQKSIRRVYGNA